MKTKLYTRELVAMIIILGILFALIFSSFHRGKQIEKLVLKAQKNF